MSRFDVAIIGAGTAGLAAAHRVIELGGKVCVVEQGHAGGYGVHHGFLPIRLLTHEVKALSGRGESMPPLSELIEKVSPTIGQVASGQARGLEKAGVTWFKGKGIPAGKNQVVVDTGEGKESIEAGKIILCLGSQPKPIPTIPFDDDIWSTDRFLELSSLPPSLLIVGGHLLGIELAILFNELGCKVFLLEEKPRLMAEQDPELIDILEQGLKKQKVKALLNKKIVSIFKNDSKIDVSLDGGVKFSTDHILMVGERLGNTDSLDLDNLSVETGTNKEIWVDEGMKTSSENIYAAGSVTGHSHSMELSTEEGRVAASNAMGKQAVLNLQQVPLMLRSKPEIASVGCFADEAHHLGFRAVEGRCEFSELESAALEDTTSGFCKIIADRETRKVVGAQIVGEQATELMSLILTAIKRGISVKALAQISFGFGTRSRAVQEAARACVRVLGGGR